MKRKHAERQATSCNQYQAVAEYHTSEARTEAGHPRDPNRHPCRKLRRQLDGRPMEPFGVNVARARRGAGSIAKMHQRSTIATAWGLPKMVVDRGDNLVWYLGGRSKIDLFNQGRRRDEGIKILNSIWF